MNLPDSDAIPHEILQNSPNLDSVITTEELNRRKSRPPNHEAENRALVVLAQAMVTTPEKILQKLTETALELCGAQTCGISLLEADGKRFYWPAISGKWSAHVGGGTPREFSPCGTVLDRNAPQLMSHVERFFPYFSPVTPAVEEALLIPFYLDGKAVGTIWVIAHEPNKRFDLEDVRLMNSLGMFASAAYKVLKEQLAVVEDRRRFREVIDALPVAVYTTDAEGRITHFNPAAVEFSGRMPQLGSDHWCVSFKLYRPDGTPLPHDQCPMAISLKEGRAVRGEEAIAERPDGTRVNFMPYPTPLFDAQGRVTGGVNMLLDITVQKQAEGVRATLAAIVESSDDAIISKNLNGTITTWNRGAELLFGYTAKEAIGQQVTMLMPRDRFNEEPGIIERLRRGERIDHYETVRLRKDGSPLDISLTVSPIADQHGNIVGASKTARDITERKRTEILVRESRDAAERANHAKDQFLAVLSHELRTPLSPIALAVMAMEGDPELPAHLRDDVTLIRRNVELEVRLIDDLLDVSRIISGKFHLQEEPTPVHELLIHVVRNCAMDLSQKSLRIEKHLDAASDCVSGDKVRLQQVFWNLLRNAVKFTPDGGRISVTTSNDETGRIRIEIEDTGIGIPPERLPLIFKAFEQGDPTVGQKFGGLGLGLAIAKAVVDRHQGSLDARSQGLGQGATFTVELPTMPAGEKNRHLTSTDAVASPQSSSARVLLVEDHEDTARMLARLLKHSGFTVETAGNAAAALNLAETGEFDIVVSDIGLPDATGYELMQRIKARHDIMGIALTGYAMDDDVKQSRAAGFEDHICKPVEIGQLVALIDRLLARAVPAPAIAKKPSPPGK